ncbi:unnamed protein product [Enterobius vermicularis]|uniref:Large ribosomal subunit protein eL28 n=1 Tax=Enterobius vermicularis TaxID=51028 RepID=A0A0N4V9Q8_ENTVE|nr:unnamed protein product [Enterobius vermicularis]
MANVSPDIQWQVIRNNSSFLRRQRGIPKQFSVEKFNVMGVNSIRHNGLIHKKAIDVRPAPDNDGVVVTLKKKGKSSLPAKSTVVIKLKKNSRRSLRSIKRIGKNYRKSQMMAATRRTSQILRSQRPISFRKGRRVRKVET